MSMCKKILIPMAAVAVVCAAVIGLLGVLVVRLFVDGFNDAQLSRAHVIAETILEDHLEGARHAADAAAQDGPLVAAMQTHLAGGARQPLVEAAASIMQSAGVDLLTVTDPAGTVLARAHDPDAYGDSLAYQSSVQNALQGRQYTTIEEGTSARLSVRCGTPVYDENNQIIGVLSLGYRLDQNAFVDHVQHLTDTEVSVFLGNTRVATTVLNENGERVIDTQVASEVSEQVFTGEDYIGTIMVVGKKLLGNYFPLRNAEGTILGMVFVGLDTAAMEARMTQDTLIMFGVVLLLGVLSVFVSWNISARLSRPIVAISNGAKQLATGNVDIEMDAKSLRLAEGTKTRDEVAVLAREFREVLKAISSQAKVLCTIADGDYSVSIPVRSEQDVMNQAINRLIDQGNEVLAEVSASASQVSIGSRRVADGAQTLAQGSTRQAVAIEQLSGLISGIADQTRQNADLVREASAITSVVKGDVEAGGVQMAQMMQAVQEINSASSQIEGIIKFINDIAFQTNILALNATIEAARAGQNGKGFAVVADEVSNLAKKSADAAQNTDRLIKNSIEKAGLGLGIATETSNSLKTVAESIGRSAAISAQIAESFDEQADAVSRINTGIEQVSQVIHHNNATAQESAAASEEMSVQSNSLARMMARFKLKEMGAAENGSAGARCLPEYTGPQAAPVFEGEELCAYAPTG